MNTSYDPKADAFYARFAPEGTEISDTREAAPGVFLDVDAHGHLVGIEVLSVRVRDAGGYGTTHEAAVAEG